MTRGDPAVVVPLDAAPDLEALAAAHPERYPYLLRSVGASGRDAGFDILFAAPDGALLLDAPDGRLRLRASGSAPEPGSGDFLEGLNEWFRREAAPGGALGWPFRGGWFLYLGYELAQQIEPTLALPLPRHEPVACAMRVRAAIVVRRADCTAVTPPVPAAAAGIPRTLTEPTPGQFTDAVVAALDAIANGDIYQANLSRRWTARCRPDAAPVLFRALTRANPAPFSALARLPGLTLVSSSPERLVHSDGSRVATRPIAGTRPRGDDPADDRRLLDELRANAKERAEHVMLIDLERNDLGRICRAGSVHVDEFMTVESYAYVHHIVSNVSGTLRADVLPGDIVRAVFPGGTITGCPKVRCMQLIAELEDGPRGAYTGSLGYLNRDGGMDLNILIRTLSLAGDRLSLGAGAGIVADSSPQAELEETRAKARGLLRAVEQASCAG